MKFKHIVILYLLAWFIIVVSLSFKVQNLYLATELLIAGTFVLVFAHLLMIVKVAYHKDPNSFLNK